MKKIDIYKIGKYPEGLIPEEIKAYLHKRCPKKDVEELWEKFCEVCGVNTCPVIMDEEGNQLMGMFRDDVERFANKLINGTPTYLD